MELQSIDIFLNNIFSYVVQKKKKNVNDFKYQNIDSTLIVSDHIDWNLTEACSQGSNKKWSSISLGNGPYQGKAITWSNVDKDLQRHKGTMS